VRVCVIYILINECYLDIDAVNMKFSFTSEHIEMLKNTMYIYVKQQMLLVHKKNLIYKIEMLKSTVY